MRMYPLFAIFVLMSVAQPVMAETPHSLTPATLDQLEQSCVSDAYLRTAQHALAKVNGDTVSQNWERIIDVDPHFSLRLKDQKITNQANTGRCWMFSALNLMRPVAAKNLDTTDFEFSQSYLMFYEKLEKANLFLDAVVRTSNKPFTDRSVEFLMRTTVQDGQNWAGFVQLVDKYGVVPKSVMPETYSSSHSAHLNHVLALRMKRAALDIRKETDAARVEQARVEALEDVYRILVINLGKPPKEFSWRYEKKDESLTPPATWTPRQFSREFVGNILSDYYALYSIPTLEFSRKYEIDLDRTVSDQPNLSFVNIPLETMKGLTRASLLDSSAVWFGCDVGQETNDGTGLMIPQLYDYASLYDMKFDFSRKELFETYSSSPGHNMVFTGVDIVDGKVKKWLVENSWGEKSGRSGYFTMLDEWFDDYVQVVVIHRKYIPQDILATFDAKAAVLPPWDPMVRALVDSPMPDIPHSAP